MRIDFNRKFIFSSNRKSVEEEKGVRMNRKRNIIKNSLENIVLLLSDRSLEIERKKDFFIIFVLGKDLSE